MPDVIPNRYPLDYSGTAQSNFIQNEIVTLQSGPYRAFAPLYAPYFKKNIHIVDVATGQVLQPTQYRCLCIVASASTIAGQGNEVYSVVVVTDGAVSNNLTVSYQSVGSYYTSGYESILAMVNNLLTVNQIANNDPVNWDILQDLPEGFPENLHLHPLGSTAGWEFLAASLEKLRLAVLLGDQQSKSFVLSYIAQSLASVTLMSTNIALAGTPFGDHVSSINNPHNVTAAQLGLGFVQNYPVATLAEAYAGARTDRYLTADLVAAVAQNRINLGMDAHILNYTNPHVVTAAQVGLDQVQNYGVAQAADLTTPVDGTNLYVTNHTAHDWLNTYFASLNSTNNTSLENVITLGDSVLATAQQAQSTANTSLTAVNAAAATIASAQAAATAALSLSNSNLSNAQNSESAAITLINEYVTAAVVAAESAAYQRGFTDGVASTH